MNSWMVFNSTRILAPRTTYYVVARHDDPNDWRTPITYHSRPCGDEHRYRTRDGAQRVADKLNAS